jgi:hypothetical protein
MLCQLSMAWLKQCAAGMLQTVQDQDLQALLQEHQDERYANGGNKAMDMGTPPMRPGMKLPIG